MSSNKGYTQNSISRLKDEETVRLRPSVIFGTNDEYGAAHAVYEIIANSIDEAREGYGNEIKISLWKDGTVEVEDFGRGIPMGWNDAESMFNWELVFCTLYASGKYDEDNYGASLGLNGLGATATQYSSEFMDVQSVRDGIVSHMQFKLGKPLGKLAEYRSKDGKVSGTKIKFKPDMDVFKGANGRTVPVNYHIDLLMRQAMLHAGLKIVLWSEELDKEITLQYDEGIKDYIDALSSKQMLKDTFIMQGSEIGTDDPEKQPEKYKLDMRLAFNFSREASLMELYHNGSHLYDTASSATSDALKIAFTNAFDDHAKDTGKLPRSEKILFKDIESILICVGDTNAPGNRTYFKNQTKAAINNPFIKQAYMSWAYYHIRNWLKSDKQSERVVTEVLTNKKAREEADKVSKKVVQTLNKGVTLGNKPKKFVDCKSKSPRDREIFIVEGDSALGACKLARDSSFQAIMPVRGKILNCLKADLSKILSNEIIIDLMRVLGCGIEAESKYIDNLPKFDIHKLNWDKVIICTDADIDGNQIRCLIITCIYRLCPSLLKAGKVYIAETPLFEITAKKETYFAYNQDEKDKIMAELEEDGIKPSQIKVQRSKGLGENDPDMMSRSTMHPDTRRLVPIEYPADDTMVGSIFNALLGDDIESRRELISAYFEMTETSID